MSEVGGGFSDGGRGWQGGSGQKGTPSVGTLAASGRRTGVSPLSPRSAPAEQAGEKTRLFHWQNRTVLHVTRTRVAIRTRHGPAVGAAAAIALARHVTAPVSYPSGAINERSAAEFPGYRRNHQAAWDWSHTSHALPRGSLHREIFSLGRVWQEWRDSNPRP